MSTKKEIATLEARLAHMQSCLDQFWRAIETTQEFCGSLRSVRVPIGTIGTCVALVDMQCSFNIAMRILEDMKQ